MTDKLKQDIDRLVDQLVRSYQVMKTAVRSHDPGAIYSAYKMHFSHIVEAMRTQLRQMGAAGFVIDGVERLARKAEEHKRRRPFDYDDVLQKAAKLTQPKLGHTGNFLPPRGQARGQRGGYTARTRGRGQPQLNFDATSNQQQPTYQQQQSYPQRGFRRY
jgi:hypothetical protein